MPRTLRSFPVVPPRTAAVAARGLVFQASAAAPAGHFQRAAARALGAGRREGQLDLVPLAAGASGAVRQDAPGLTPLAGARFLGIDPLARALPATHNHRAAALALVAVGDQMAHAITPQALHPWAFRGLGLGGMRLRRDGWLWHFGRKLFDDLLQLLPLFRVSFPLVELRRCLGHGIPS